MAEVSLKKKTLGLNVMEQRVTTAEKALEIAKQKANLLSTQDKWFYDYKGREKAQK